MSVNHYHSAGAVCAGNRNWFTRSRASPCPGHWISQCVSPAVCQDPKLGCRLDGNSVAEKRSEAWESKQKRSVQQRKMETLFPWTQWEQPAMLPRLCIANRRFSTRLPGRRMRGLRALSLWHPCYYCHLQVAGTHHDRGNWGFGVVLYQTTCLMCDSQAALPVGGDLESTVAFWYICGFSSPKIATCWSGSISKGERISSDDMDGHISGQTPVNRSKPVSSNLLNWVHLRTTHPVSAWEGWIQLPSPQSTAAAPSSAFPHLLYHCKWSSYGC